MSLYICPKCDTKSFTWAIEDEPYIKTNWDCYTCNYLALEDERLMRDCKVCKQKSESVLKDMDRVYWWCFVCNKENEKSYTAASELTTATSELSTATSELSTATCELSTATSELPTATSELSTATSELSTATSELSTATSELPTATSELSTATSELSTA